MARKRPVRRTLPINEKLDMREAAEARFVILIDILGFSDLIRRRSPKDVYEQLVRCLSVVRQESKELLRNFELLYFSDTILLWEKQVAYGPDPYLYDLLGCASDMFNGLLADAIPTRIGIARGTFVVKHTSGHNVFFGEALVEAHEAQAREKMLGIVMSASATEYMKREEPDIMGEGAGSTCWVVARDTSALVNPYWYLHGIWHANLDQRFTASTASDWHKTMVRALDYVLAESERRAEAGDFTEVAAKYHATTVFCRQLLGTRCLDWVRKVARELRKGT